MRPMRSVLFLLAALAFLTSSAEAGPFRRSVTKTTASACVGGHCNTASVRTVERGNGGAQAHGVRSAQAHAEAMAASGVMVHASSHPGFEGVGYGSTPERALAACCNNGGEVIDQGVAYGHGRWFACVRRR